MLFGFNDVLLCVFRILFRCLDILSDVFEVFPLLVHVSIDLFCDVIDVSHQLFDIIQVILSLLDHVSHVICFSLHLELVLVDLLLLQVC